MQHFIVFLAAACFLGVKRASSQGLQFCDLQGGRGLELKDVDIKLCPHVLYTPEAMLVSVEESMSLLTFKNTHPQIQIILLHVNDNDDDSIESVDFLEKTLDVFNFDGIAYTPDDFSEEEVVKDLVDVCSSMKRISKKCYLLADNSINILKEDFTTKNIASQVDGVIMTHPVTSSGYVEWPPSIHTSGEHGCASLDDLIHFWMERGFKKSHMFAPITLTKNALYLLREDESCQACFGEEYVIKKPILFSEFCNNTSFNSVTNKTEACHYGYAPQKSFTMETPTTIELKTNFLQDQGLGGFVFGPLHQDILQDDACEVGRFGLLKAAVKGFALKKKQSPKL